MSGRRNKRGGGGEGGGGEERWLLPYADMITLLLGLFIVLFALSSVDAKKLDGVSAALSKTFKGQVVHNPGGITPGATSVLNAKTAADSEFANARTQAASQTAAEFSKEQAQLDKVAKEARKALGGKVDVKTDARGIVVSIAGDTLFASGSDRVNPQAVGTLQTLARHLAAFNHPIEIQGYTDGQPIGGGQSSNMRLSGNRAASVWELMTAAGFPKSLANSAGFGEEHPVKVPVHPTDNMPANRRVEIHILAPGANDNGLMTKQGETVASVNKAKAAAAAAGADPVKVVPPVRVAPEPLPAPSASDAGASSDLLSPVVGASN
jgi:chemotaxis protein MotB